MLWGNWRCSATGLTILDMENRTYIAGHHLSRLDAERQIMGGELDSLH